MNETWAFEVITQQRNDDTWIVAGYAFKTIQRLDTLTMSIESDNATATFLVEEITMYGHHIEKIERGSAGQLILRVDGVQAPSQTPYLYKVEP